MAFSATRYASEFLMNLDQRNVARQITNQNYTVTGARTVNVYDADDLSAQDKNADNTVQIQNPSGGAVPMTLDQEKDLTVGIGSVEDSGTANTATETNRPAEDGGKANTATETSTAGEDSVATNTTGDTTSEESPGFGVITAALALLVGALLLYRQQ